MHGLVWKKTKNALWKVCKFFKNDSYLIKGTKFVMEALELREHADLSDTALMEAQEMWIRDHSDTVRLAMNDQRNYVQQELRKLVFEIWYQGNDDHLVPNVEEIMDLMLRKKLDEETPEDERIRYQALFDFYWNVLIPKVAGHASFCPSKRHHQLLSTGTLEEGDPNSGLCVTAEDEAFLVTMWQNCYPKWWYLEERRRNNEEVDPNHQANSTPFTEAKGGQKKFGGWKPEGIRFYHKQVDLIQKNRDEEGDYIARVEAEALQRIRTALGCDAKEAKRKKRKRKASLMDFDDDESEDEGNYGKW